VVAEDAAIRTECETGAISICSFGRRQKIEPDLVDFVCCIVSEAEAGDYATFEAWAPEMGYDTDSKRAEAICHECMRMFTQMRAVFGNDGLAELYKMFRDY